MEQLFSKLGGLIAVGLIAIAGWFAPAPVVEAPIPDVEQLPSLGASIPKAIALFETSLASKINKTDTSMTLVRGTDKAGTAISGYVGFILDEGSATEEFIACNASSTALTSCLRGISVTTGNTTSSALAFAHGRGASVKITNFPSQAVLSRILNGDETLPNVLQYSSNVTNASVTANGANLVNYATLASTSFSGTVDSAANQKGIVEIATSAELSTGATTGDTSAPLVPRSTSFNSTSSATTTVPVTKGTGKLSQTFLDFTEPWSFGSTTSIQTLNTTGTATFNGTTTFSGAVISSASFPGTKVFAAVSSTAPSNVTTEVNVVSSTIPANVLSTSNALRASFKFDLEPTGGNPTSTITFRLKYGSATLATSSPAFIAAIPANTRFTGMVEGRLFSSGTNSQRGSLVISLGQNIGSTVTSTLFWFNTASEGSSAVDSTQAQPLQLSVQFGNANPSSSASMVLVEKFIP